MTGDLPEGFIYRPAFLSEAEEEELLTQIRKIQFSELQMRGVVARRRVAHFGWLYGYESWQVEPGPPIPQFPRGVKERTATLA